MKIEIDGGVKLSNAKELIEAGAEYLVAGSSVFNGEPEKAIAGFKDIHTGKFEEVMLIRSQSDLDKFKTMYGIEEEIAKEY